MNSGNNNYSDEFREKYGLYDTIKDVFDFIASNPKDQKGKNSISDDAGKETISHYMKPLYEYAKECDSIVEIGVNQANTTYAFLHAQPKDGLISIDIDLQILKYMRRLELKENVWLKWAEYLAKKENIKFSTIESDSLGVDLPDVDLIFIDSEHTYGQLKCELTLHGNKSKKYIILHDTTFYSDLNRAINEFLTENNNFVIHEVFDNHPGLTILKRIN